MTTTSQLLSTLKKDQKNEDITRDIGDDAQAVEETFGRGANKKVLLVTKGISLKNLVETSK